MTFHSPISRFRGALMALVLASPLFAASGASAAAPQLKTSAPGYFRTMLGDYEVTALSDGTVELPVDKLLKQDPAVTRKQLADAWLKTPLETSVNAYLVNTGKRLVLIDTGAGSLFGPTLGRLAANLKASGYHPEQVDDILITHMHLDHVGGLSKAVATLFPKAVVHADRRDAEYWLSPAELDKAPADEKGSFKNAQAMLEPYVKAHRFQTFDGATEFAPGIHAVSSYGHTPGHTSYLVESQGQKMLVTGDLIHVGAVQWAHPTVTMGFDSDTKAALSERLRLFDQAAQDGTILAATHIAFPGMGHVRKAGEGYEWLPLNYTQFH